MNSFDLFDTLVARRCVEPFGWEQDLQMDEEVRQMIPIQENILKVRPEDIIVSDMYLPEEFLKQQLKRVTNLDNELIVGQLIKRTGKAWKILKQQGRTPKSHTDDSKDCLESAKKAGIQSIEVRQSDLTDTEKELRPFYPSLAKTIREARLKTYNSRYRNLELLQIEVNFPILFLASVMLHRRILNGEFQRVLMASRDCFLWHKLQTKIRDLTSAKYDVFYFLTSRIARTKCSDSYLKYVNDLSSVPSLMVELVSSGKTLTSLIRKLKNSISASVITRCLPVNDIPLDALIPIYNDNSSFEDANSGRHQMVVDVREDGSPVYWKGSINWENWEEIEVMHNAFDTALSSMQNYDFGADLAVPTDVVLFHLSKLYQTILRSNELNWAVLPKAVEEIEIQKELRGLNDR